MPTAVVNGIDVAFERSGEGPRLLYIGGSGSSLAESALFVQDPAAFPDVVDFLAAPA